MSLKHENGPKAKPMQLPRKEAKISRESHTISERFFARFIANSHPRTSSIAQNCAGLGRVKFLQVRVWSVMSKLNWPKLPLKKLSRCS